MRTNGHGRPVFVFDVDGTLAAYHEWFLRFAELYFGRPMPDPAEINPGLPLHKFMGVSKERYRACKLAYRQGGLKRSMPCLPGAAQLFRALRRRGEVWVATTRPYLSLSNIDPDTREWMRRNRLSCDALLFGHNKYYEVMRQAGDRVVCAFEDLPELGEQATRAGVPFVFYRAQPYNEHLGPTATRWTDASQAYSLACMALTIWKGKHGDERS